MQIMKMQSKNTGPGKNTPKGVFPSLKALGVFFPRSSALCCSAQWWNYVPSEIAHKLRKSNIVHYLQVGK